MSAQTQISWADSTVNFWEGCTKVSAGCANCYAEARDKRFTGGQHWGNGAPRRLSENAFKEALRLNRKPWVCQFCGYAVETATASCDCTRRLGVSGRFHRRRIFSLSLGDWLDPEVPVEWLARMLDTIRQCDQVTWILCTKRPEMWNQRIYAAMDKTNEATAWWLQSWDEGNAIPPNVILLASVENQEAADLRIPALFKIPAACYGVSLEPLLGPVDLTRVYFDKIGGACEPENVLVHGVSEWALKNVPYVAQTLPRTLSWLVIGGESGPKARPCNVAWIRSLVQQGKAANVAVHVKQLGRNAGYTVEGVFARKVLTLDPSKGGDWDEWPVDLRVREWPQLS